MIVWRLDLQLPMQLEPITSKVVSSNPAHDEVYSIPHYVIKFLQGLATGWWFSPDTLVSSINKTDHYDIIETLLKVAFNTIKQASQPFHIILLLINFGILF
jgi:hypothetical protein